MTIIRNLCLALLMMLATVTGASAQAQTQPYKVAIHIIDNNPATMTLALNNVQNMLAEFQARKEKVDIEVVAYGPGLHMLREDTSPVKARIATMSLEHQNLQFSACANTQTNHSKQESKEIKIISEAKMVPAGVVRLVELQRQGYAYIKP
jgi:intracellular sulfur oxidation DsrE/DsrF family protein